MTRAEHRTCLYGQILAKQRNQEFVEPEDVVHGNFEIYSILHH